MMQPEERDLIAGLFGRLKEFEAQPRDREAEALIGSQVASQPAAPYLLVQTVLVQEQALKAAQQRIAEIEAKVAAAPPPGFLASAPKIGPWGAPAAAATAGPSTRSPLQAAVAPAAPAPAGGGFLRQALTTAAGVAGGALMFEGIRSMLGHNPGPFGSSVGPAAAAQPAPLLPPDSSQQAMNEVTSDDLAQDDGSVDDYDTASDDSSGGGSDDP